MSMNFLNKFPSKPESGQEYLKEERVLEIP
jgi:hypothetical protein